MRAHRAVPVRSVRQRLVEIKPHAEREMPHRVAPRGRHRRRARRAGQWLVQEGRSRDDVRVREGEHVDDERAQLRARGRVHEDAAGHEARASCVFIANHLLSCGRYGNIRMQSATSSELRRRKVARYG